MDPSLQVSPVIHFGLKQAGSLATTRHASSGDTQKAFAELLQSGAAGAVSQGQAGNLNEKAVAEFATVITSQFIGEVLKQQDSLFGDSGNASQHYHSMMVDAVSEELTKVDALGLKSVIEWEISRW